MERSNLLTLLNNHVTGMAKAHEIIQIVGLNIMIVLAFNISKLSKRLDVMHVKLLSCFRACCSALPASVVVSLASFSALRIPIGAVVRKPSALPSGIAGTDQGPRSPRAITLLVAEIPYIANLGRNSKNFVAAIQTRYRDPVIVRTVYSTQVICFPFTHTSRTTKEIILPSGVAFPASKSSAALSALNRNAVVVGAICAGMMLLVSLASALKIAVVILVSTELAYFSGKLLSAFGANQILAPDKLCLTSACLASVFKSVSVFSCSVEVVGSCGFMIAALGATFKGYILRYGIMGLHKKFTFLLPSPRLLAQRWDICFSPVIIPQMTHANNRGLA